MSIAPPPRSLARIRRARDEDATDIAALTARWEGRLHPVPADLPAASTFWVADTGAGICGCVALAPLLDDVGELRSLAVDPAWRRAGIGGSLVEALLAHARACGPRRIYLRTFETGFFARFGFSPLRGAALTADTLGNVPMTLDLFDGP